MAEIMQCRVAYTGGLISGPAVSTIYFSPTGSDTVDATAARDKLAAFFAAVKANFCQVVYHFGNTVDILEGTTGVLLRSVSVPEVIDSGSASGDALPPATQLNLRFETGVIADAHRLRGHWYMPGFAEASSNGAPSGSIFTTVASAKTALLSGSVRPIVWHRPKGVHGSVRLGLTAAATDALVQPKFAILRSRRD